MIFSHSLFFPSCRTQSSSLYSVFDHTAHNLLMFMLTKLSDVKQILVLVSLRQQALETSPWTSIGQIAEPVSQGFWSSHLKDGRHVVCRGHGAGVTLGDFTFWISLSLRPKTWDWSLIWVIKFALSPECGLAERTFFA